MRRILNLLGPLALACVVLVFAGTVSAQEQPFRFAGTTCTPAPYLHCPDSECSGATVVNQGNVVEMKTRRTYFLDYPCDLKPGESATGSTNVFWGRDGFTFERPGHYVVDVITMWQISEAWVGADAEVHVWVSFPVTAQDNNVAALLLHPEVGQAVAAPHAPATENALSRLAEAHQAHISAAAEQVELGSSRN
jgi:hypothetical protein